MSIEGIKRSGLSNVFQTDVASDEDLQEAIHDHVRTTGVVDATKAPYSVDTTGTVDATAALQQAANDAATLGCTLTASGTLKISSTVQIKGHADLRTVTINSTAADVTLLVGDRTLPTFHLDVTLPYRITCTPKTELGWAQVPGMIGVELANLYTSRISIGNIRHFETGLKVWGYGRGTVHNDIRLGGIESCKIGMVLGADAAGWVNQNVFTAGRISMSSNEGAAIPGTVFLKLATTTHIINSNIFNGLSIEANGPEYHLDACGIGNLFTGVRWENPTGARAIWRTGSTRNIVSHGYGDHMIVHTYEDSAASRNTVEGAVRSTRVTPGGAGGSFVVENTGSSADPAFIVMQPGAALAGSSPATAYAGAWSANGIRLRRTTETNDRIQINSQDSKLYIGNGAAAPSTYLGAYGSSGILVGGGHFVFAANGTHDFGSPTFRPRDIYVANHIRLGTLYLRDNAGVLEKSTDGAEWTVIG